MHAIYNVLLKDINKSCVGTRTRDHLTFSQVIKPLHDDTKSVPIDENERFYR